MTGSRTITQEEISRLKEIFSPRDRLLLLIGLHFGTRISETLAFRFKDFEGSHVFIKSCKGSDNARFIIPDAIREAVAALWAELEGKGVEVSGETPIFISQKSGSSLTKFSALKIIKSAVRRVGLTGKVTSHSFRKNFVTKCYELTGKDPIATRKFSRHKSLTNLIFYVDDSSVDLDLIKDLKW